MRLLELRIERPKSDKNFPRNIMPQIRKGDIKDSPFEMSKGKIDITKLKPVQAQRVKGMHDRAKRGFADGSIRPIIVDKDNYIVNGHHRFDIALEMGMKKVKVIKVDATVEDQGSPKDIIFSPLSDLRSLTTGTISNLKLPLPLGTRPSLK